jgi:uncharacterized membrane protein
MRFTSLSGYWGTLLILFYFVVAAYAAIAVYRDAQKNRDLFLGLHPIWWAAMTLVGSITGVVAYWALHYSNLRHSSNKDKNLD